MSDLFKRLLFFTDIHYGRSSNAAVHLKDNDDFLDWMIDAGKTAGCDTVIFGGDYFDNRHSIHVQTMNHALDGLQKLNDAFDRIFFIPGNHDLFHRERRDVSSIALARNFSNIRLISDPTTIGGVTFLPWLVGDEYKRFKTRGSRYTFAHLEMPGFLMNAKVPMPESSHAVDADSFNDQDLVFTGHFHMRQQQRNVIYTGNVMPFTHADSWDADRGMMILDWGGEPDFRAWPDQPLFRSMRLSEVIGHPDRYLTRNLTAKIALDVDISYDEAQAIRDAFVAQYGLRKMELVQQQGDSGCDVEAASDIVFQSVDQIVIDGLRAVNSMGYDPETLVAIYRDLPG